MTSNLKCVFGVLDGLISPSEPRIFNTHPAFNFLSSCDNDLSPPALVDDDGVVRHLSNFKWTFGVPVLDRYIDGALLTLAFAKFPSTAHDDDDDGGVVRSPVESQMEFRDFS